MLNFRSESKLTLLQKCFIFFTAYSVIGWLYETVLELFIYQTGFSNRGFLFGPYCVVYGFGMVFLLFCLIELKSKKINVGRLPITPILVFIGIGVLATKVELIASYLMEWFTGSFMWDYERFAFDFQGRIALNPSLRFAAGGTFLMYAIQPILEKITDAMSKKTLGNSCIVLALLFVADIIYTVFFK